MIDTRLRLSVFHDDNGVFANKSDEALDFSRDTFSITLVAAEDYLYIGFYKPIGAVYCEIATVNTNANTFAMQYYDGTTWSSLEGTRDLTKGFTRSGWIAWTRPTDWTETAVNSSTMYWVRLRPSVTHSATTVAGINLILADDYDLQTEFPNVIDTGFIPTGEVSHIRTHTAVRNQLIQDLRNRGYLKLDAAGDWQSITPWDLLDIEEVKQAATYLALSKIFFNYSDDETDHWRSKSKYFEAKYKSNLELIKLTVDSDDDGAVDDAERQTFRVSRMYR